jgi:murein DD-endopeptidase MepM/ murein hydrolase activator NlpD
VARSSFDYSVNSTGPIRWPFPAAVQISSGYGDRAAPCRGCSSNHKGIDFTPGTGTPIFAMADGVVTTAEYAGAYGQHVVITHEIDGQKVTSLYAHMQSGSSPLQVGQQVKVGDLVGLVGRTGAATGAHLHFEITLDGENVDPYEWLQVKAV